jgi:hypothetical protein
LFAYQNTVAQAIGMERAMALNTAMVQSFGAAQGKQLSKQFDIQEILPEMAGSLAGEFLERSLGIRTEAAEGDAEKAVINVGRCPIYEAAQVLGMEHDAIEALCRAGSIPYMDALINQLNPDLDYDLRQFRPSADGSCIEVIVADGRSSKDKEV